MAIVQFDREAMNKPRFSFFDKAGAWGPGCDHEAECSITAYHFPSPEDPAFDKAENVNPKRPYRGPYVRFDLLCVRDDERNITDRWYVEQNKALVVLTALGVHVDDDGAHDSNQVEGLKCIVIAGNPGKNKAGEEAYSSIRTLQSAG